MNSYVRGQPVHLTAQVYNALSQLSDATTVTVRVTDPKGKYTDYTLASSQVIRDSVGTYHYDLSTSGDGEGQLGLWIYAWLTTGPDTAAKQKFQIVSEVTPP